MSLELKTTGSTGGCSSKEVNVQFIPANIEGSSQTNVNDFFTKYTAEDANGNLYNTFRGYSLNGCVRNVPDCYAGVVVEEENLRLSEMTVWRFKEVGNFNKLVYWNYDKLPYKTDAFSKQSDVIDISNILCEDVTASSMEDAGDVSL